MIFKGTIDKVLDGTKTQTRRLVKDDDYYGPSSGWFGPERIHYVLGKNSRMRFSEARTYAVQPGRGKSSIARIKINKIHKEKLIDISINDCIAEGIETTPGESEGAHVPEHRERFAELWNSLYKDTALKFNAVPHIHVWVLEFELVNNKS